MSAAYDEIADWYETEFLAGLKASDPMGVRRLVRELLGHGSGTCLEVGCGTGIHADDVRAAGWSPVGVDVSRAMLSYARGRLPTARADAARLPLRTGCVPAVLAAMVHTDMPRYPAVLREAARILQPGGLFVHVGVHPCFCGGFADRTDPAAVVVTPGYRHRHWTKETWNKEGVRGKVGASHWPLAALLQAFRDADLTLERFAETGEPLPIVFAVSARKAAGTLA